MKRKNRLIKIKVKMKITLIRFSLNKHFELMPLFSF